MPAAAGSGEPLVVGTVPIAPFDALVYEAPILQYQIKSRGDAVLTVLDGTFDNHGYAFALAACSPHRETINREMLRFIASDDWQAILTRYLGN